MCGILGIIDYAPKNTYARSRMLHRAITNLLKQSQVRGSDATGLFILTDKGPKLFKTNLPARNFVATNRYSNLVRELKPANQFYAVMGHTRARTQGTPKENVNNHPIVAGDIVGVHNGIISNDDALFKEMHFKRKGEVDSEIIFQLIKYYRMNKCGMTETIRKTHMKLRGSYACAFMDLKEPTYLMLFNASDVPNIHIYIYRAIQTIVFASSIPIIRSALKNNGSLDPKNADMTIPVKSEGVRINILNGSINRFSLPKKSLSSTNLGGNCLGYMHSINGGY